MYQFGKWIAKHRILVLLISVLLLIPSAYAYMNLHVNYDILYYLPSDIETMQGQEILQKDFGKGAYAMFVAEDMTDAQASALKSEIEHVDHVANVIWYDSILDPRVPSKIIPDELYDRFHSENATLMAIFFDTGTSDDETMDAIDTIREVAGERCFLNSMSAIVTDTKHLVEKELFWYVLIAVVMSSIVLALTMDSFLSPVLFLLNIGMAIIYNMGTNFIQGEISFVTMSLAAVLQLAVTMDYAIFLWNAYREQTVIHGDKEDAMAYAIVQTIGSVSGSSLTTIAGFAALCFMSFTLGMDLGIVMAKGVLLGVITCITVLPAMILVSDRAIQKTAHKPLTIRGDVLSRFVVKHNKVFLLVMILLWIPALIGYQKMDVYYQLDKSLPSYLPSVEAKEAMQENFDMSTIHLILASEDLPAKETKEMLSEMKQVDGVTFALSADSLIGSRIPDGFIPDEITKELSSGGRQLMLLGTKYEVASDEVNAQVGALETILKRYDPTAMLIGEAPGTRDLIRITDIDFKMVSAVSIGAIFLIILFVLHSPILPVILVLVIELAIYINLGVSGYTGESLPFVASIVIGTIQLGATVDYAILMTERYLKERDDGKEKTEATVTALSTSLPSILTSALGFFAATIGVGIYSDVDMIGSLCRLMARGALISMASVLFLLPSFFLLFDGAIMKTRWAVPGKKKGESIMKTMKKTLSLIMTALLIAASLAGCSAEKSVSSESAAKAAEEVKEVTRAADEANRMHSNSEGKEETVYVVADAAGHPEETIVSTWLKNPDGSKELSDTTSLTDIENVKGDETYTVNENGSITWDANGNDIYYQGSSDKELPVSTTITYTLDGKKADPDELAGANGHLTIEFSYENKTGEKKEVNGKTVTLYQPFLVISGLMLDGDHASNISVSNGRVVNTGDQNLIFGMAMPGLRESLAIDTMKDRNGDAISLSIPDKVIVDADVTDFELLTSVTVITNDFMKDLDFADMDSIDDLTDAVEELKDASQQLVAGTGELYDGISKLSDGSTELTGGIAQLDSGANKLRDGASSLKDGTRQISDGAGSLYSGTVDLANGAGQVSNGAGDLKVGADALRSGSSALADGAGTLSEKMNDLNTGMSSIRNGANALDNGIGTLRSSIGDLPEGTNALYQGSVLVGSALKNEKGESIYSGAKAIEDGAGSLSQGLTGEDASILSAANGIASGAQQLSEGAENISTAASQLEQTLNDTLSKASAAIDILNAAGVDTAQYVAQAQQAAAALEQIKNGADAISNGLTGDGASILNAANGIAAGAEELDGGATAIGQGAASIATGVDTIVNDENLGAIINGLSTLNESAVALTDGVDTLKEGSSSLAAGTKTAADGASQLADGAASLKNGANAASAGVTQLADGAGSLRDGASKVASGAVTVRDGAASLSDGAKAASDGASALSDGALELKDGTGELADGGKTLTDGITQLLDGAGELRDGMTEFDEEGIEELSMLFEEDAKDLIERFKAVQDLSKEYTAFDGESTENGSVQFILRTASI